jgi:hypothetical protein
VRSLAGALLVVCAAIAGGSTASAADARWSFALPAATTISVVRIAGDEIVAAGDPNTFVLERSSGRVRWRSADHAAVIASGDGVIFFGTLRGGAGARRASDGALLWHDGAACPKPAYARNGQVTALLRAGGDLIVGCSGGRVVRTNARDGRIEAHSDEFLADQVSAIVPLGSCAFGVSGSASGAYLRSESEILGCRRLNQIVPENQDTTILGVVGEVAVLDDWCRMGRAGVYRPATIFHADLRTGEVSRKIDLAPEPARFPAASRPSASAGLVGRALYLCVARTMYRYDEAAALSPAAVAHRVAEDVVDPPQCRHAAGADPTPELQRVFTSVGPAQTFMRIADGRRIRLDGQCYPLASDRAALIAVCTTSVLAGNRYLQRLTSFRWN